MDVCHEFHTVFFVLVTPPDSDCVIQQSNMHYSAVGDIQTPTFL